MKSTVEWEFTLTPAEAGAVLGVLTMTSGLIKDKETRELVERAAAKIMVDAEKHKPKFFKK